MFVVITFLSLSSLTFTLINFSVSIRHYRKLVAKLRRNSLRNSTLRTRRTNQTALRQVFWYYLKIVIILIRTWIDVVLRWRLGDFLQYYRMKRELEERVVIAERAAAGNL